jgi:hypothetical protein
VALKQSVVVGFADGPVEEEGATGSEVGLRFQSEPEDSN